MRNPDPLPLGDALRRMLAPARSQRLEAIVTRGAPGEHLRREAARLTGTGGLEGDRWAARPRPEAQLTLMDARVVRLLLAQREGRMAVQGELYAPPPATGLELPGDNLIVDLQTDRASLPARTRLRIGEALIQTNDLPHLGCKKFEARFGADALAWINDRSVRDLCLRGIHATVISDGLIRVGDLISFA